MVVGYFQMGLWNYGCRLMVQGSIRYIFIDTWGHPWAATTVQEENAATQKLCRRWEILEILPLFTSPACLSCSQVRLGGIYLQKTHHKIPQVRLSSVSLLLHREVLQNEQVLTNLQDKWGSSAYVYSNGVMAGRCWISGTWDGTVFDGSSEA